jgi:hypothetical protein
VRSNSTIEDLTRDPTPRNERHEIQHGQGPRLRIQRERWTARTSSPKRLFGQSWWLGMRVDRGGAPAQPTNAYNARRLCLCEELRPIWNRHSARAQGAIRLIQVAHNRQYGRPGTTISAAHMCRYVRPVPSGYPMVLNTLTLNVR